MKSDFLVFLVPLALILALVFSPRLRRARVRDRLRTAWGKGAPGRTPVSYTHLDVYKRQAKSSIVFITGPRVRSLFIGHPLLSNRNFEVSFRK